MNIMKEIEEQKFLLEEEKTRFEAQKILHSKKTNTILCGS